MFERLRRLCQLLRGTSGPAVDSANAGHGEGAELPSRPVSLAATFRDAFAEARKVGITPRIHGDEVGYDGSESFHYHDDDYSVAKGMTKAFNEICSSEGVQVTSTMNPATFQIMYQIKNVCDKVVQVFYDQTFELLEPGEECIVQVTAHSLHPARPYFVKVLNGGVDA